jgi:hypothetical protein
MKEAEMTWACSTHGEKKEIHSKFRTECFVERRIRKAETCMGRISAATRCLQMFSLSVSADVTVIVQFLFVTRVNLCFD